MISTTQSPSLVSLYIYTIASLQNAPEYPSGSTIIKADTKGERMFFFATVKNTKGEGILGVKADTWQADGDGVYDVQYQGGMDDRGRIVAEPNGDFCYRGVLPTAYHVVRHFL